MKLQPDSVTVIFGQRGSGKTYLARRLLAPYPRVLVVDPLWEYPGLDTHSRTLPLFEQASSEDLFRLCYRPLDPTLVSPVCWRALFSLQDYLLVIDEADQFAPVSGRVPLHLRRLVMHGRHQKISLVAVVRRPAELWRGLTSQAVQVVSFRQVEPRDVAYVRAYTGLEADQLGQLGRYEALLWTAEAGGARRVRVEASGRVCVIGS